MSVRRLIALIHERDKLSTVTSIFVIEKICGALSSAFFTTSRPEARTSEPEKSLVRVQVGRNDDIEDQYGNHSRIADDLYQPGPCIPNRTRQQHHLFGCNKFTVELHFRSLLSGVGGFSNASDSRSPFLEENISAACMYYLGARYRVHPYTAGMFFVPFFLSRIGLYGIHPQLL